jgi:hypothetical protein
MSNTWPSPSTWPIYLGVLHENKSSSEMVATPLRDFQLYRAWQHSPSPEIPLTSRDLTMLNSALSSLLDVSTLQRVDRGGLHFLGRRGAIVAFFSVLRAAAFATPRRRAKSICVATLVFKIARASLSEYPGRCQTFKPIASSSIARWPSPL